MIVFRFDLDHKLMYCENYKEVCISVTGPSSHEYNVTP